MILFKSKKIIFVIIGVAFFIAILFFFTEKEEKLVGIGVIADIHAGKEKK